MKPKILKQGKSIKLLRKPKMQIRHRERIVRVSDSYSEAINRAIDMYRKEQLGLKSEQPPTEPDKQNG